MYLHLGQNVVVPSGTVIGIFDMDNTTGSYITRRYLNEAEKKGHVVTVTDDIPKSFVICDENGKTVIYLSLLSSLTLMKRFETMFFDN